mmetsp:Transcript_95199/g.254529  ORF Transcript_95199/g.254529 Transcript_95199/m.254529 type:complete len:109 (+) Transcript_95199:465-791(+)
MSADSVASAVAAHWPSAQTLAGRWRSRYTLQLGQTVAETCSGSALEKKTYAVEYVGAKRPCRTCCEIMQGAGTLRVLVGQVRAENQAVAARCFSAKWQTLDLDVPVGL